MQRFKKIKKTSTDKIHIEYEKMNKNGEWDAYSMTSAQEPAPSFDHALDNLIPHIEEMCELPEKDHQVHPYTVRGVSLSYGGENETLGVTITATRALDHSNSPLVLNSPHKISEPYAEGSDETQVMSDDCLIDLQILFNEARDYLDGKRAQADLFVNDESELVAD
jgi:hypothetical protein